MTKITDSEQLWGLSVVVRRNPPVFGFALFPSSALHGLGHDATVAVFVVLLCANPI